MMDDFRKTGGRIETVSRADLAVFEAVQQLQREHPNEFEGWLRQKRPLSGTTLFRNLVAAWLDAKGAVVVAAANGRPQPESTPVAPPPPPRPNQPSAERAVLVGTRDGLLSQPIEFPAIDLTRHVVIRAGSGGGKTVLIKRLVEEAALAGVSSIVIDSARDLSFLGDRWPEKPEGWLEGDAERADRYLRDVKVRIWTPGRRDGRPILLSPLPDFRSRFEDPFEFEQAVQIATDSLGALLISGRNRTQPMAVLQATVKHFASQQGHELQALADLLQELPESATPNISRAPKMAKEIGDQLNALMLRDPMLSQNGQRLEMGDLFGKAGDPPTISVVSLFGLNDLSSQASFVGRLAMALFDWIRRNPARDGLRGLFVIDEAAPFLPRSSSESKPALMLLSQQARKYGVGLLVATQNPMDLDYNATAQFATQFFGTANQPQVVKFIADVMEQRGLRNLNPASLKAGSFYVSAPSLKQPIKIQIPMCLSWHPRNRTPTDEEILDRVRRDSR
jgi:DNA helicase HerA-like ATPase